MELVWMEDLVHVVTDSLRNSSYRKKAAQELRSHLTALYEEGQAQGLDADGAEQWALEHIGVPADLKKEYARAEALRDSSFQYYRQTVGHGVLICWAVFFFNCEFLFNVMLSEFYAPMITIFHKHPDLALIYSILIHCIPFAAVTYFLRRRFQGQTFARARVLGGLIFTWLCGTLMILLLYGFFFHQVLPWQVGEVMVAVQRSKPRLPWFTPAFCGGTLLHCFFLGLLPLSPCRRTPIPAQ